MRVAGALLFAYALFGRELTFEHRSARVVVDPAGAKVTAVVFISAICPVSNAYIERLNAIYRDYSQRGVQFAFVNTNANEPAEQIEKHAAANRLAFPVFTDPDHLTADLLEARMTPEVFLLDRDGVVRYRGPIDDALNPARVRARYFRDALDALLAGRAPVQRESGPIGCSIKRTRP
jgi:hypothetical protein